MRTVSEIIQSCGGPKAIEAEANRQGVKLTAGAVKKWGANGIPEKNWCLVLALQPGISIEVIYAANQTLREGAAA